MDVGITLFPTDSSITPTDLAVAVEERGFESLWFPEHSHIPTSRKSPWPGGGDLPKEYYDVMDQFVALAMAGAATRRIKLGTGICLVVQRDPIYLAKQVATLDLLTGGRYLFGIGAGWNAEEMADHGTAFETRTKLMRERIEVMKAIWTKSKVSFQGEFHRYDEFMAWPKPVQKPHPPVIVGGAFPHGAKRAIAYGDGWMPIGGRAQDPVGMIPRFRQMVAESGRDPASMPYTAFAPPPKADMLKQLADAGCDRAILMLPPKDRDTVLPLLDQHAALLRGL